MKKMVENVGSCVLCRPANATPKNENSGDSQSNHGCIRINWFCFAGLVHFLIGELWEKQFSLFWLK